MSDEFRIISIIENLIKESTLSQIPGVVDVKVLGDHPDFITVEVYFDHRIIDSGERTEVLDDFWRLIKSFTGWNVYTKQKNGTYLYDINESKKETNPKTLNLLQKFMEDLEFEGICGFWVDDDVDESETYWVYIVIDIDWLKNISVRPEMVANRLRKDVEKEIQNFLGIKVRVGSTARKCPE